MKFLKKTKKKPKKSTKGTRCLNCGHKIKLEDNFCSNCGQTNDTGRISLKHYFSEYLSGFFSFDNRFFSTIKPLLFKPGKVTREYIEGKRTKYVNPFQLYLHITIIFFLMIGFFKSLDQYKDTASLTAIDQENQKAMILDSLKNDLNQLKKKDSLLQDENSFDFDLNFSGNGTSNRKKNDSISIKINKNKINNVITKFMRYDKEHENVSVRTALKELGYEDTVWNNFYYNKARDLNKFSKGDHAFIRSYINNFISKISIALFFLLPLFTLFVALLYLKSDYNYSEHLVFVFHVQTVFFIMLITLILFDRIFNTDGGLLILFLLFLFYLYKSLKNFFREGWFITFIKFIILNFFYLILSVFGLILVAFIAFLI